MSGAVCSSSTKDIKFSSCFSPFSSLLAAVRNQVYFSGVGGDQNGARSRVNIGLTFMRWTQTICQKSYNVSAACMNTHLFVNMFATTLYSVVILNVMFTACSVCHTVSSVTLWASYLVGFKHSAHIAKTQLVMFQQVFCWWKTSRLQWRHRWNTAKAALFLYSFDARKIQYKTLPHVIALVSIQLCTGVVVTWRKKRTHLKHFKSSPATLLKLCTSVPSELLKSWASSESSRW